jgi:hypothetical protein
MARSTWTYLAREVRARARGLMPSRVECAIMVATEAAITLLHLPLVAHLVVGTLVHAALLLRHRRERR